MVRALTFPPEVPVMSDFDVLLRGYDQGEVDGLLARIEGTLGRAPLEDARVTAGPVPSLAAGGAASRAWIFSSRSRCR